MKIFTVDFEALYPVPSGLIITAKTKEEAAELAAKTVEHTEIISVKEVKLTDKAQVIFYESGDY